MRSSLGKDEEPDEVNAVPRLLQTPKKKQLKVSCLEPCITPPGSPKQTKNCCVVLPSTTVEIQKTELDGHKQLELDGYKQLLLDGHKQLLLSIKDEGFNEQLDSFPKIPNFADQKLRYSSIWTIGSEIHRAVEFLDDQMNPITAKTKRRGTSLENTSALTVLRDSIYSKKRYTKLPFAPEEDTHREEKETTEFSNSKIEEEKESRESSTENEEEKTSRESFTESEHSIWNDDTEVIKYETYNPPKPYPTYSSFLPPQLFEKNLNQFPTHEDDIGVIYCYDYDEMSIEMASDFQKRFSDFYTDGVYDHPLFSRCQRGFVFKLINFMNSTNYYSGETIAERGTLMDKCYIILYGECVALCNGEMVGRHFGEGSYFGELFLIFGKIDDDNDDPNRGNSLGGFKTWQSDIIARTTTCMIEIEIAEFIELLGTHISKDLFYHTIHHVALSKSSGFKIRPPDEGIMNDIITFSKCSPSLQFSVFDSMYPWILFPGSPLFEEGTPNDAMHLLYHGVVSTSFHGRTIRDVVDRRTLCELQKNIRSGITKTLDDDRADKKEIISNIVEEGYFSTGACNVLKLCNPSIEQTFFEGRLLRGPELHTTSCYAKSTCVILTLRRAVLWELLSSGPTFEDDIKEIYNTQGFTKQTMKSVDSLREFYQKVEERKNVQNIFTDNHSSRDSQDIPAEYSVMEPSTPTPKKKPKMKLLSLSSRMTTMEFGEQYVESQKESSNESPTTPNNLGNSRFDKSDSTTFKTSRAPVSLHADDINEEKQGQALQIDTDLETLIRRMPEFSEVSQKFILFLLEHLEEESIVKRLEICRNELAAVHIIVTGKVLAYTDDIRNVTVLEPSCVFGKLPFGFSGHRFAEAASYVEVLTLHLSIILLAFEKFSDDRELVFRRFDPGVRLSNKQSVIDRVKQENQFMINSSPEFMSQLVETVSVRLFTKNDYICEKGQIGDTMLIIVHGNVRARGLRFMEPAKQTALSLGKNIVSFGKPMNIGAVLGELAVLSDAGSTRQCHVVVESNFCLVWVVERERLLELLNKYPKERIHFQQAAKSRFDPNVARNVIDHPLFRANQSRFRSLIAVLCQPMVYLTKDTVVDHTQVDDKLYIINYGRCDVYSDDQKVGTLLEGDHIGYTIMLGIHSKHIATLKACNLCHVITISRSAFTNAVEMIPSQKKIFDKQRRKRAEEARKQFQTYRRIAKRKQLILSQDNPEHKSSSSIMKSVGDVGRDCLAEWRRVAKEARDLRMGRRTLLTAARKEMFRWKQKLRRQNIDDYPVPADVRNIRIATPDWDHDIRVPVESQEEHITFRRYLRTAPAALRGRRLRSKKGRSPSRSPSPKTPNSRPVTSGPHPPKIPNGQRIELLKENSYGLPHLDFEDEYSNGIEDDDTPIPSRQYSPTHEPLAKYLLPQGTLKKIEDVTEKNEMNDQFASSLINWAHKIIKTSDTNDYNRLKKTCHVINSLRKPPIPAKVFREKTFYVNKDNDSRPMSKRERRFSIQKYWPKPQSSPYYNINLWNILPQLPNNIIEQNILTPFSPREIENKKENEIRKTTIFESSEEIVSQSNQKLSLIINQKLSLHGDMDVKRKTVHGSNAKIRTQSTKIFISKDKLELTDFGNTSNTDISEMMENNSHPLLTLQESTSPSEQKKSILKSGSSKRRASWIRASIQEEKKENPPVISEELNFGSKRRASWIRSSIQDGKQEKPPFTPEEIKKNDKKYDGSGIRYDTPKSKSLPDGPFNKNWKSYDERIENNEIEMELNPTQQLQKGLLQRYNTINNLEEVDYEEDEIDYEEDEIDYKHTDDISFNSSGTKSICILPNSKKKGNGNKIIQKGNVLCKKGKILTQSQRGSRKKARWSQIDILFGGN